MTSVAMATGWCGDSHAGMVVTSADIWQHIPRFVRAPESIPQVKAKYCTHA